MTEREAWQALAGVVDPELGLVCAVEVGDHALAVTMTLTTAGCPLHDVMVEGVERALRRPGGPRVDVEIVFDPPWDPGRIAARAGRPRGRGVTARRRCEAPGRRTVERRATVGGPPWPLPPALLAAAALAQVAGAAALLVAAPDLARGIGYSPAQLGAVHLLGLAFLTVAITGSLLQLVPVLLRRPLGTPMRGAVAGTALVAGSWALRRDPPSIDRPVRPLSGGMT